MKFTTCLVILLYSYIPTLINAQSDEFQTCYMSLCADGELTTLQLAGTDKIEVRSLKDGSSLDIISFTVVFKLGKSKVECLCSGNTLTPRCLALRDKLSIDDQMLIEDVVYKDVKGGGEIRTAPELAITVVKPVEEKDE